MRTIFGKLSKGSFFKTSSGSYQKITPTVARSRGGQLIYMQHNEFVFKSGGVQMTPFKDVQIGGLFTDIESKQVLKKVTSMIATTKTGNELVFYPEDSVLLFKKRKSVR